MEPREPHLIIASGGTGGHFYPALAIAREFRKAGGAATFVVAGKHSAEQAKLAVDNGFEAFTVPAARLPGDPVGALTFPFRMLGAIWKARQVLKRHGADLVLGMGSFAAVPACLAAPTLRIPLVLHEGNSHIGRANRYLSRAAKVLATSLPLASGQRCGCPQECTGLPLREELVAAAGRPTTPPEFHAELGLTPGKRTLLVFGGSQGASFLNELMAGVAGALGENAARLQVIHLTGTDDNAALEQAYVDAGVQASVRRADYHIENCYLVSDLVMCRAGASTISELALFGKPALLVPLPTAAENHQLTNATVMGKEGAARLLRQDTATPAGVAEVLVAWLDDPEPFETLGVAIRAFARPQAAGAVARLLHDRLA